MQKNPKFKIIIFSFLAIIIVLFFGFYYRQNLNKKVELNFSQNQNENVSVNSNENNEEDNFLAEVEKEKVADEVAPPEEENKKEVVKESAKMPDFGKEIETEKENPAPKNGELKVINHLVSWGFQKSVSRKIDTIIVHSSYDAIGNEPYSVSGVIAEYKSYGVSPHYLISREGEIYRLVEDKNIAYHAGESKMPDGRTGVNNFSIGVEMFTTKKDKLTDEQYTALNSLIKNLKEKYKITAVLGHNQIAPDRKDDPWNFEWGRIKK